MDLLKTPHQLLLEEAGAHIDGDSLLMTPAQKLFDEMGVIPHFAKGKEVKPKDMEAEIFIQKTLRPVALKFANGGQATDPFSHPDLVKAFNAYFK